jgi:hypothetical protein
MNAPTGIANDDPSWRVMKIRLFEPGRPGLVGIDRTVAQRLTTEQGNGLGGS